MGELLVHSLISYAKQQGDKAKSADEAERADKLLKQKGIDKTRTAGDKGSRGAKGLSKEQKDIADKLGISYDSYAKFVPKEKE
jgi:phage I-like protein